MKSLCRPAADTTSTGYCKYWIANERRCVPSIIALIEMEAGTLWSAERKQFEALDKMRSRRQRGFHLEKELNVSQWNDLKQAVLDGFASRKSLSMFRNVGWRDYMREHTNIPDNKEVRTASQASLALGVSRLGLSVIFFS